MDEHEWQYIQAGRYCEEFSETHSDAICKPCWQQVCHPIPPEFSSTRKQTTEPLEVFIPSSVFITNELCAHCLRVLIFSHKAKFGTYNWVPTVKYMLKTPFFHTFTIMVKIGQNFRVFTCISKVVAIFDECTRGTHSLRQEYPDIIGRPRS